RSRGSPRLSPPQRSRSRGSPRLSLPQRSRSRGSPRLSLPQRRPATTTALARSSQSGSTTRGGFMATGPRKLFPCTGPVTKPTEAEPPRCMRCQKYFIHLQISFPDNTQLLECSRVIILMSPWRRA
ncbi:mCG17874, partial [Mus musculus]